MQLLKPSGSVFESVSTCKWNGLEKPTVDLIPEDDEEDDACQLRNKFKDDILASQLIQQQKTEKFSAKKALNELTREKDEPEEALEGEGHGMLAQNILKDDKEQLKLNLRNLSSKSGAP